MKKILSTKTCMAGSLAAILFALFALTTATSAPVVVIPGEGAGYIYYGASAGPAEAAPASDPSFVGMVVAFDRTPPVDTWVPCHGQTILATQYPELVKFLAGEGVESALMPDYRGYFLRVQGIHGSTGVYSDALGELSSL